MNIRERLINEMSITVNPASTNQAWGLALGIEAFMRCRLARVFEGTTRATEGSSLADYQTPVQDQPNLSG